MRSMAIHNALTRTADRWHTAGAVDGMRTRIETPKRVVSSLSELNYQFEINGLT